MTPLHFVSCCRLAFGDELSGVESAQHQIVWRLKLGGDPAAPLDGSHAALEEGDEYHLWDVLDEGRLRFSVWVFGAELVAFIAGTQMLVNHTIQSSLELDDPYGFSKREWTHACQGSDCSGCHLPR